MGSLFALGALAAVVAIVLLLRWRYGPTGAHDVAETFGGVGSLVATAFVALTLFLQSRELRLQRRELELQREEMQDTRGVLAEQSAEFRRQSDLMARGLAKDIPRLAADFAVRDYVGGGDSTYTVRVRNIGDASIREVTARIQGGEARNERTQSEPHLAPGNSLTLFTVSARVSARDALAMAKQGASRAVLKFKDTTGVPHRWTIEISALADGAKVYYPPSNEGDARVP
ncbi:MAG: hypothetical protein WAT39_13010 [Planctomycetota bacterium]